MPININCEQCGAKIRVRDEFAGRKGKCPSCQAVINIPANQAAGVGVEQPRTKTASNSAIAAVPTVKKPTPADAYPAPEVKLPPPSVQLSAPQIKPADILAAIPERVPRVKLPIAYRLAALLAAVVMILLPIVYLCLIALVVLGVIYHATHNMGILTAVRGRAVAMALIVYAAPIVCGGILIFFMIKPIFARASNRGRTRTLTPEGEPLLFQFVERLTKAVGAPMPRQIQVDADVNASAAFRRGFLSLILGNDLVLTIGMPLVAGLNVRQFAGVLAHEFGHFSQGTGMRLTYIVRSISAWFMRVVYERDQWDDWLVETAQQVDLRIGWVLYIAQLCVWLTRRVLWVLMFIGNFVSGFLLRQMEFDADRYEARLAGSETFQSTVYSLHALNLAQAKSFNDFGEFFRDGRLADNLPRLISINLKRLPDDARRELKKVVERSKTGIFDTHPCDRQRIENAQREQAGGLFQIDAPATVLFRHYDTICRNVTWDTYCAYFGNRIKPDMLHPLDELLDLQSKEDVWKKELDQFFLGQFHVLRPLPDTSGYIAAPQDAQAEREKLLAARKTMEAEQARYSGKREKLLGLDQGLIEAQQMLALCSSGITPDSSQFSDPLTSVNTARSRQEALQRKIPALTGELKHYEQAASSRLYACLRLLHDPRVAARITDAEQMQRQLQRLLPALNAMSTHHGKWNELRAAFAVLGCLCAQLEKHHRKESLIHQLQKWMEKITTCLAHLREALVIDYPFDHKRGSLKIGEFLISGIPQDDLRSLFQAADHAIDEFALLYARVIGNLAIMALQVESVLKLPALQQPAEQSPEIPAPAESQP